LENVYDLARTLREIRLTTGKNQAEFAKMLGVPQTTWSGYERGDTRPKLALLIALETMGYSIPGFTSPVRDMIESGKISEEEAREKIDFAQTQPDMDIDDLAKAVDEHWHQVKKVAEGHPVPLYSEDDFADGGGFEVPLLHQKLSAGKGMQLPENDEADAFVRVPSHLKRYGKNLAALTVEGDSMYPTLDRGDLVICDSCGWSGEGVYALRMGGDGFVKRITRDPGKIIIISDNPKYPIREYKENIEDFEIIGRVHCAIKNLE
jgi:phage repressor protein C with HTH and peptisase S24 domain/DNA-binding XRE family transcriptional regulator